MFSKAVVIIVYLLAAPRLLSSLRPEPGSTPQGYTAFHKKVPVVGVYKNLHTSDSPKLLGDLYFVLLIVIVIVIVLVTESKYGVLRLG